MRRLIVPVAVVGLVLISAVLAAPVHDIVVDQGWFALDPAQPDKLFLKVFRRLLLISLGAFLAVTLRPWRDGTPKSFGLVPVRVRACGIAWLTTLAVGALVLGVHLGFGWQQLESTNAAGVVLARIGRWAIVGFLIAAIEEWFFRGWLADRLGRARAPFRAALGASAIYALLHAFRPGALDALDVDHDMGGALEALGGWLGHLLDPAAFGPLFLGLFLLGLLLAGLVRRSSSLWPSIGVHAAGILLVYGHGAFTRSGTAPFFAGTKRLFDGAPGWIALLVAVALVWRPPGRAGTEAGLKGRR